MVVATCLSHAKVRCLAIKTFEVFYLKVHLFVSIDIDLRQAHLWGAALFLKLKKLYVWHVKIVVSSSRGHLLISLYHCYFAL